MGKRKRWNPRDHQLREVNRGPTYNTTTSARVGELPNAMAERSHARKTLKKEPWGS